MEGARPKLQYETRSQLSSCNGAPSNSSPARSAPVESTSRDWHSGTIRNKYARICARTMFHRTSVLKSQLRERLCPSCSLAEVISVGRERKGWNIGLQTAVNASEISGRMAYVCRGRHGREKSWVMAGVSSVMGMPCT